jgi:diaminohydroxyphosphoribosylaminopyrimidine deaminase/5-amino-6-(5-phosphoribosylamino)uracil reductase
MGDDVARMRRALKLARRALGRTAPNPLVGAVVVAGGQVVGEGYHHGPGTPHAEIHALSAAGSKAQGATLYVTLEPCCHTDKRTPPCVPAVLASGVERVVIGMTDPNPAVSGGGVRALEMAGVTVTVGVMETECQYLNAPYTQVFNTGLPWLTLKMAQTLDGKVATASGDSKWITGETARRYGHRLRDRHEAILVGAGTVLADDPQLTCRIPGGRDPLPVVVDSNLSTPVDARLLERSDGARPVLCAVEGVDPSQIERLRMAGADVLTVAAVGGRVDLRALLKILAARGVHRVLCEGGPTLSAALLAEGLVNRVACFIAPTLMGGDDARGSIGGKSPLTLAGVQRLGKISSRRLGSDLLLEADILKNGS